jgi:outer membrane receptor protein involved in Fe transport
MLACVLSSVLLAAEAVKKRFDLPADTAENSLKRLAAQSGREVLFLADAVENMRTQAVMGEMEPRAALESMLVGTTLIGVEDAGTGAITIRRVAVLPPKANDTPRVDTSSARAAAEPLSKAIELSPFEITESSEDKWSSTSTLLGNRTGQELVKVPVTVDVLTRDFMNDIGVFNLEDAAAFVSGVTAVPRIDAKSDNDRLTFRGLTSGGSGNVFSPLSSRNFFPWMVPSDTYNVERFDFGKGSNSLMFGDSAPGGQATTTTKRARFITSNEGLAFYDSFGSYRMQLDVNRKISQQLAVRLNLVNRSDKGYVEGNYQRFRAVDFAIQNVLNNFTYHLS